MSESRLPQDTVDRLATEALEWDELLDRESPGDVAAELAAAELHQAKRPPRQPLSVRLDPRDISMLKRIARRKGIPHSQLMALWLHERLEKEARGAG